ncbi:glycerophosphodiester phosphodiesterase [Aquimarina mytili]|uniref:Glycerophosphodiester phosphodiesterase n=1 Tax=Aquimarina mytili TaxID=874423 RepID=A0A937A0D4_9FLAO|nr:glycerophosphodiester phosphodiesterase family protein [Aquimarina mytili]MBL0682159.1 glycerophosphodiester phosphodiesterase [Aquimarina mytili]
MKIFGHRGAAGLIAENTLESITAALEHGVDGIEIDVHRCKSGELVVIHDNTLQRTTNGQGNVSKFTWSDLKKFRTIEGYMIPLLDQVLDLIDAKCVLNIELKGIGTALPTIELLEKYIKNSSWKYDDFIISSFDHSQLFQIKSVTSKFNLGVLTEENSTQVLKIAKELNAFSVHPPVTTLTKDEVDLMHQEGYQVYVWTVNDKTLIDQSKSWNVEGIITDFPNLAK